MTDNDHLAFSWLDLSNKLFDTGLALAVVATMVDAPLMFFLFFFSAFFFLASLWFSRRAVKEFLAQSRAEKGD